MARASLHPMLILTLFSIILCASQVCGQECTVRLAIVGAGISGSSLAYFLSQEKKHMEGLCIDVYDKKSRPDKTSAVRIDSKKNVVVDIERSGFLKSHRICMALAKMFGLKVSRHVLHPRNLGIRSSSKSRHRRVRESSYALREGSTLRRIGASRHGEIGVWNGNEYVFRYRVTSKIRMLVKQIQKMLRKYGADVPMATFHAMKKLYFAYEKIYTRLKDKTHPAESLEDLLGGIMGDNLHLVTLAEHLGGSEGDLFLKEIVDPILMAKYGQPSSEISALAGLFGLLNSQFMNIYMLTRNGFRETYLRDPLLYFEQGSDALNRKLIKESSKAKHPEVRYLWGEKVKSVVAEWTSYNECKFRVISSESKDRVYDYIAIATPLNAIPTFEYQRMDALENDTTYSNVAYKKTVVTLVQAKRLRLGESTPAKHGIPSNILFSGHSDSPILSVSSIHALPKKEFIYRIYSTRSLKQSDLKHLFGSGKATVLSTFKDQTNPVLAPFEKRSVPGIEMGKHVFVTHAVEAVVSSLETKLACSYNVANIIAKRVRDREAAGAGTEKNMLEHILAEVVRLGHDSGEMR